MTPLQFLSVSTLILLVACGSSVASAPQPTTAALQSRETPRGSVSARPDCPRDLSLYARNLHPLVSGAHQIVATASGRVFVLNNDELLEAHQGELVPYLDSADLPGERISVISTWADELFFMSGGSIFSVTGPRHAALLVPSSPSTLAVSAFAALPNHAFVEGGTGGSARIDASAALMLYPPKSIPQFISEADFSTDGKGYFYFVSPLAPFVTRGRNDGGGSGPFLDPFQQNAVKAAKVWAGHAHPLGGVLLGTGDGMSYVPEPSKSIAITLTPPPARFGLNARWRQMATSGDGTVFVLGDEGVYVAACAG